MKKWKELGNSNQDDISQGDVDRISKQKKNLEYMVKLPKREQNSTTWIWQLFPNLQNSWDCARNGEFYL